jgi:beta-lactamase superfamily II metal-dependent hydrolase
MPVIKLAFLDVGQGDTTVISCPETNEAIVVDCTDSETVLDYFEREHISQLRGVIITHLHADHYGNVAELLYNCADILGIQGCEVLATGEDVVNPANLRRASTRKKWPADDDGHSSVYEQAWVGKKNMPQSSLGRLYQWTEDNEEKCRPLRSIPNYPFPIEGTLAQSLQVLHPPFVGYQKLRMSGLNNTSIVLRVTGTRSSALLTGDLEPTGWQSLKRHHPKLESDVLKFPHHGGAWEEAEANNLLSTINPNIVVISVGSNNSYNHPRPGTFAALHKRSDIRLLCTQATDNCQPTVLKEREKVISTFQAQSRMDNSLFNYPRDGQCPCAGTIIIELGDKPYIVQPNLAFHEAVINTHYKRHKCHIRVLAI